MKTTKENIDKLLSLVKHVFENYSEHNPVLTGSLAMYLNGLDYGEIHDVDLMFLNRQNVVDKPALKAELAEMFPDIPNSVFVNPAFVGDTLETEIDGVTVTYIHHASLYEFLKGIFDYSHDQEKRLRQFAMYEEWLNSRENLEYED